MDKLIIEYQKSIKPNINIDVSNNKLYLYLKANFGVSEQDFKYATIHSLRPLDNYTNPRFFEMAILGDSFLKLVISHTSLNLNQNKSEMNQTFQQFASNKYNSSQFIKLLHNLKITPEDVIISYEVSNNSGLLSEKLKETCYEGILACIYLANLDKPMKKIIEYYNSFVQFINE